MVPMVGSGVKILLLVTVEAAPPSQVEVEAAGAAGAAGVATSAGVACAAVTSDAGSVGRGAIGAAVRTGVEIGGKAQRPQQTWTPV